VTPTTRRTALLSPVRVVECGLSTSARNRSTSGSSPFVFLSLLPSSFSFLPLLRLQRSEIPSDLLYTNNASVVPNPANWGTPAASYLNSSCSITDHFSPLHLTLDITLCGDYAGTFSVILRATCERDLMIFFPFFRQCGGPLPDWVPSPGCRYVLQQVCPQQHSHGHGVLRAQQSSRLPRRRQGCSFLFFPFPFYALVLTRPSPLSLPSLYSLILPLSLPLASPP
jgi:hypothetical protein